MRLPTGCDIKNYERKVRITNIFFTLTFVKWCSRIIMALLFDDY